MKLSTHPLADQSPGGAAAPVDQHLILRLRVSFARLLAKGDELPKTFYAILFDRHPSLRPLFPQDMTRQREKLANTLAWIVTHLDRPDLIVAAVGELGRRHVGYGARPELYPLVSNALVEAMGRTGGRDWSEELAQDWRRSIELISRHMIAGASAPTPVPPPISTGPR